MSGTAVAVIYCPEGIAIAADGREKCAGTIVTNLRQKIFSFNNNAHTVLAYALTGCVQDDDKTKYDLESAVADALKAAIPAGQSVRAYLVQIGEAMRDHLDAAKRSGAISKYPQCDQSDQSGLIATLVVGGFYEKSSFIAQVTLSHNGQRLEPPRFHIHTNPWIPSPILVGPPKIEKAILDLTPNPLSKKYQKTALGKLLRREPNSLDVAVMAAEKYIEAVMHRYSLKLDPHCDAVGGHIHSATVTLEKGFCWKTSPEDST